MSSEAGSTSRLIEVQQLDTLIDQLRHRRDTLPEKAELSRVEAALDLIASRVAEASRQRDLLGTKQAVLDDQVESARARKDELERRLYGGQVNAARELQAIDEEVKHLAGRVKEMEDLELDLMEQIEPFDAELAGLESEIAVLEEEASALIRRIQAAEMVANTAIADKIAERTVLATDIPDDLLKRYEELRSKLGGTGAALVVGGSCGGCHLVLPSMEIDRIRKAAPGEVITCEQCGRILLRPEA